MEKEKFYIYNNLIYNLYDLMEQVLELNIEIVGFVCSNFFFNNEFLKDMDVSERLYVLVDTGNIIVNTLDTIMYVIEDAYTKSDFITLENCSRELLKIEDFLVSYENYLNLLKDYKLCMDDYNVNLLAFKFFSSTYDECLKNIVSYYNLVIEERLNKSIAKEEEMFLIRKDRQLVKLGRKYLKKLEK